MRFIYIYRCSLETRSEVDLNAGSLGGLKFEGEFFLLLSPSYLLRPFDTRFGADSPMRYRLLAGGLAAEVNRSGSDRVAVRGRTIPYRD